MKASLDRIAKIDVYWWLASDSPNLYRYAAKAGPDIERFSPTHVRVRAKALDGGSADDLEIIIRFYDGRWVVKCDAFADPSEDYPFTFAATEDEMLWTDARFDELMVIQGT